LNEPKHYRAIMLSSTFTDLKKHREQTIRAIREFGFKLEIMEHSGARADADVIDSSLQTVRDSVAHALIIGRKYGQTPVDPKPQSQSTIGYGTRVQRSDAAEAADSALHYG
jgi:hypothetical protein